MRNFANTLAAGMFGLVAAGCGMLVDMGKNREINPRRVFVNDAAANDSLPQAIVDQGVLLVLQPGKPYTLRVQTGAAGGLLDFFIENGNVFSRLETIPGTAEGGIQSFALQAPGSRATAAHYIAFLRAANGGAAIRPDRVRLFPADTSLRSDALAIRLFMIRDLHGLAGAPAKAAFAQAFHAELRDIYSAYGISVDTSTVIVEPDGAPLTVDFASPGSLPGNRLSGAVNIYLVDSIRIAGDTVPGMILGFAPREAFDLAASQESRVVLNVRGSGGSAVAIATTAAHEAGHFFGLRHTTATGLDMKADNDASNRDDGFASTALCVGLEKAPARELNLRGPGGRPYCLYVAATASCGCPDRDNLMFPYACNPVAQRDLEAEQRALLRGNLRLYQ